MFHPNYVRRSRNIRISVQITDILHKHKICIPSILLLFFISFYWHVHFYSSLKAVFGLAFRVLVRMFWLNFWSIGWSIYYIQELYIQRIYRFTAEVGTYSSAKNPPYGWGFELGTYPGAGRQCSMTLSHTSVSSSSMNSLKVLLKLSYLDIFEPMCEIIALS
jgi:hypothetical protein